MIELRCYFCGNRWCAHLIHYTPIHEKTISNWTRRCRITNHHVAISIPDREFCAFLCAFSNQTVKLITNHCTAQNRTMDQHFSLTFAISSYIYIYLFFFSSVSHPFLYSRSRLLGTRMSAVHCSATIDFFSYKIWYLHFAFLNPRCAMNRCFTFSPNKIICCYFLTWMVCGEWGNRPKLELPQKIYVYTQFTTFKRSDQITR